MILYQDTLLKNTMKNPIVRQIIVDNNHSADILLEGNGVNITLDGQAAGCYPKPDDRKNWTFIIDSLNLLNPSWLCITLPIQNIHNENGTVNTKLEVFKQFMKFGDWARKNDRDIVLMYPKSVSEFMRFRHFNSSSAPADLDAYVKLICGMLDFLIHTSGYTNIKYLSIFGEAFNADGEEFAFAVPANIDPYEYYFNLHKKTRKALDTHGFKKVLLLGPNSPDIFAHHETEKKLTEKQVDLYSCLGAVDTHCYRMRFDYLPPSAHVPAQPLTMVIDEYLKPAIASAHRAGKAFFVTELGCMYYGKSAFGSNLGPSRYEAMLTEIEFIIRAVNAGADGILKWVFLFNTENGRGHYQMLEKKRGKYSIKNNFYAYSFLNTYLKKGSEVLKSNSSANGYLWSCVVRSSDGKHTILTVNDHPANVYELEVFFEDSGKKVFHQSIIDSWGIKENIKEIFLSENKVKTDIPPFCFSLLTE